MLHFAWTCFNKSYNNENLSYIRGYKWCFYHNNCFSQEIRAISEGDIPALACRASNRINTVLHLKELGVTKMSSQMQFRCLINLVIDNYLM